MSTVDPTVHSAASIPGHTLADLEERMQMVLLSNAAEENGNAGETFAQRAEWYYHKRPQLLSLLQDLHNSYLTLLDRYHHSQRKSQGKGVDFRVDEEKEDGSIWSEISQVDLEAESCLTFSDQQQQQQQLQHCGVEELMLDLLAKDVQNDVLVNQLMEMDRQGSESWRKIELLKKLLELLESERLMLSDQNARLGYKVAALSEENKALHSEAMIMKRKALELGRSMLRMREDYRVCMLNQKITDLQQQICFLEKRNDEYHQQLMKRDGRKQQRASGCNEKSVIGARQVRLVGCFQMETLKFKRRSDVAATGGKRGGGKMGAKWWKKGRMIDLLMCGLNNTCSRH